MNVKELKLFLEKYPDDMEIFLKDQDEGALYFNEAREASSHKYKDDEYDPTQVLEYYPQSHYFKEEIEEILEIKKCIIFE